MLTLKVKQSFKFLKSLSQENKQRKNKSNIRRQEEKPVEIKIEK
jgi:hypothetical protein